MCALPVLSDFIFAEKLGRGSYAAVYKAFRKEDKREVVAIKCVLKSSLTKSAVENLLTEISILKKVKHENIVELKDFQWDNNYIYLILEYCSGGDLSGFIRQKSRLPETVVQRFLQKLVKALQVLHSHNIAHMDLKPQNILLSNSHHPVLKLGDFGFAQYLSPGAAGSSLRGSPLYMAPEILLKHKYDARVDLWSVGIILYECLFGQAPFSSNSFSELAEKIRSSKEIELPYGVNISDECRDLLLGLLKRDPSQRLSFNEFFNHPFVDLEHMPSVDSYSKGVSYVQQAVQQDADGNFETACHLYGCALEYLVPHIHSEPDHLKRGELRKKVFEYMSRAEELKKCIQGMSSASDNLISCTSEIDKLPYSSEDSLSSNPILQRALTLGAEGDSLVRDGRFEEASKFYQESLELMVPAVAEQPPGYRKELLYAEVNKWMKKAEELKSFLKVTEYKKTEMEVVTINHGDIRHNTVSKNLAARCAMQ